MLGMKISDIKVIMETTSKCLEKWQVESELKKRKPNG